MPFAFSLRSAITHTAGASRFIEPPPPTAPEIATCFAQVAQAQPETQALGPPSEEKAPQQPAQQAAQGSVSEPTSETLQPTAQATVSWLKLRLTVGLVGLVGEMSLERWNWRCRRFYLHHCHRQAVDHSEGRKPGRRAKAVRALTC